MKTISLKALQNGLSRDEMRAVKGGCFGGNGKQYKCCWVNTNNCSTCNEYTSCVSGAELRTC